jgi:hypothetical protein
MRQVFPVLLLLLTGSVWAGTPGAKAGGDPASPEIRLAGPCWQAQAQRGDWILVRVRLGAVADRPVETVQRTTVTAVTEEGPQRLVTVTHEVESGGNKEKLTQVYRLDADASKPPGPAESSASEERRTVAGKALAFTVRERAETDGAEKATTKTWSSTLVPLGGCVRIERNGKAVYELLDFGRERTR